MDRYSASIHGFESDNGFVYDYPRRGGPLDRDDESNDGFGSEYPSRGGPLDREDDYDRLFGHGGQRSGRDHRSALSDDEDADLGRNNHPTHRGLPNRRGTDPYASDDSVNEHEYEPRNRHRGRAGGVRGDGPRRHGLSSDSLDDDCEFENAGRGIRGQGSRRGALSHHPDPRFNGEYSEDESEFEPRATREGQSGLRRGADQRRRPDPHFDDEDSEDVSDIGSREGYGHGGRRSMAASYADHRGPAHASSMDDESEYELHRRGYGRDVRGGMHPRHRRHYSLSGNDLDDSEDEGMRGGRRAAPSFGGSSRREFY